MLTSCTKRRHSGWPPLSSRRWYHSCALVPPPPPVAAVNLQDLMDTQWDSDYDTKSSEEDTRLESSSSSSEEEQHEEEEEEDTEELGEEVTRGWCSNLLWGALMISLLFVAWTFTA